jgi:DNA polymerase-3 subunit epsilon
MHPDGKEELKSHRINPGIPIPAEATEIHGITNEDVVDKPHFHELSRSIYDFLNGCDIAGFNVKRFDLRILEAEFRRVGVEFSRRNRRILDALIIYHKFHPRDLAAAYKEYCGGELEKAHSSEGDVRAAVRSSISLYLLSRDGP